MSARIAGPSARTSPKKNCVAWNVGQARRDWARRACSFNVWQPSGWIIRDVLAGTGYEITEAEDGEHALAAVAKTAT